MKKLLSVLIAVLFLSGCGDSQADITLSHRETDPEIPYGEHVKPMWAVDCKPFKTQARVNTYECVVCDGIESVALQCFIIE